MHELRWELFSSIRRISVPNKQCEIDYVQKIVHRPSGSVKKTGLYNFGYPRAVRFLEWDSIKVVRASASSILHPDFPPFTS